MVHKGKISENITMYKATGAKLYELYVFVAYKIKRWCTQAFSYPLKMSLNIPREHFPSRLFTTLLTNEHTEAYSKKWVCILHFVKYIFILLFV